MPPFQSDVIVVDSTGSLTVRYKFHDSLLHVFRVLWPHFLRIRFKSFQRNDPSTNCASFHCRGRVMGHYGEERRRNFVSAAPVSCTCKVYHLKLSPTVPKLPRTVTHIGTEKNSSFARFSLTWESDDRLVEAIRGATCKDDNCIGPGQGLAHGPANAAACTGDKSDAPRQSHFCDKFDRLRTTAASPTLVS